MLFPFQGKHCVYHIYQSNYAVIANATNSKKHAHDISGPIIKWMRVMFDCNLKFASFSQPIRCKTIPSCDMDTPLVASLRAFLVPSICFMSDWLLELAWF